MIEERYGLVDTCRYCGSQNVHAKMLWFGARKEYWYYCEDCHLYANEVILVDKLMADGWFTIPCSNCRGYGVVSQYTYSGDDFLGAGECPYCGGSGSEWVTPSGRLMDYPSGRFTGRLTEKELIQLRDKYGKI